MTYRCEEESHTGVNVRYKAPAMRIIRSERGYLKKLSIHTMKLG
jgi:hypothetical protein